MAITYTATRERIDFEGSRVTLVRWEMKGATSDGTNGSSNNPAHLIQTGTAKRLISVGYEWSSGAPNARALSIWPKGDNQKQLVLLLNSLSKTNSTAYIWEPKVPVLLMPDDAIRTNINPTVGISTTITVYYIEI